MLHVLNITPKSYRKKGYVSSSLGRYLSDNPLDGQCPPRFPRPLPESLNSQLCGPYSELIKRAPTCLLSDTLSNKTLQFHQSNNESNGFSSVAEALALVKSQGLSTMVEDHIFRMQYLQHSYQFFAGPNVEALSDANLLDSSSQQSTGSAHGIAFHVQHNCPEKIPFLLPKEHQLFEHTHRYMSIEDRLISEGAIMLGKTSTLVQAPHVQSKGSIYVRNPHDWNLTTGSTSGGSAGAISAGIGHVSICNDDLGSLRVAAALTGCVGFKPRANITFFVDSEHRITFARDQSSIGFVARSVEDCSRVFDIVTDNQLHCTSTLLAEMSDGHKPSKIAWFSHLPHSEPIQSQEVLEVFESSMQLIQEVFSRQSPSTSFVYMQNAWEDPSDACETLHYLRVLSSYHHAQESKHKIIENEPYLLNIDQGTDVAYWNAIPENEKHHRLMNYQRLCHTVPATIEEIFSKYDFIITPTMPVLAWKAEEPIPNYSTTSHHELVDCSWNPYTFPFNWSDNASITIPCGYSTHHRDRPLPVGMQIVARTDKHSFGAEHGALLALAGVFEFILNMSDSYRPSFSDLRHTFRSNL